MNRDHLTYEGPFDRTGYVDDERAFREAYDRLAEENERLRALLAEALKRLDADDAGTRWLRTDIRAALGREEDSK